MKARQHDDDGSLCPQIEPGAFLAHEADELFMHHLDEGLPGGQALGHFDADRPILDGIGEALDHRERHIRIEQCEAHLTNRLGDVLLAQMTAAGERLQSG